jgi:hypothetical protein
VDIANEINHITNILFITPTLETTLHKPLRPNITLCLQTYNFTSPSSFDNLEDNNILTCYKEHRIATRHTAAKRKHRQHTALTNLSSIRDPITRRITSDPTQVKRINEQLETKALSPDARINPRVSFLRHNAIPNNPPVRKKHGRRQPNNTCNLSRSPTSTAKSKNPRPRQHTESPTKTHATCIP